MAFISFFSSFLLLWNRKFSTAVRKWDTFVWYTLFYFQIRNCQVKKKSDILILFNSKDLFPVVLGSDIDVNFHFTLFFFLFSILEWKILPITIVDCSKWRLNIYIKRERESFHSKLLQMNLIYSIDWYEYSPLQYTH